MKPKEGYRKPSYADAGRYARIVYELLDRPHGWSLEAIQNELRISERTLYRYTAALKEQLTDDEGRPLIEVFRRGERRLLRFAPHRPAPEPGPFDLAFLFFALTVFQFLDGTVIKEGVDLLWEKFRGKLPFKERLQLADFQKKFYAMQYAVKDYGEFSETLDEIFQCVVRQYRLRLEYEPIGTDAKEHVFDPYTLAMHRGGLYLIGRSSRSRRILTLAIERIRKAEKLAEHFDYPRTYAPEKHTAGAFGIIVDEEPIHAKLLLMDRETATYVGARRLHATQKLVARRGGKAVLSLTVEGVAELRNWIAGFGPHIKVLAPRSLRDSVRDLHAQAAALYRAP
jgi:predicted DNA-binding transcriptional regulator YafY